MTKACTATLKFILPIDTKFLKDVDIIVKDYKASTMYTVTKHLSDCIITNKSLTITISAEEMANFKEHNKAKIQLIAYFVDGTKNADNIFYREIKELLDEEVI